MRPVAYPSPAPVWLCICCIPWMMDTLQAHGICNHDHDIEFHEGDSVIATVAWMIKALATLSKSLGS